MGMIINPYVFAGAGNGLLNSLVSYYKCDTSGSFPDSHGSNDGTISGATFSSGGGILNSAYDYDGLNDYIGINGVLTSLASDTSGSFSVWVKMTNVSDNYNKTIFSFGDTNDESRIVISLNSTGRLRILCTAAGVNTYNLITDATPFSNNTWQNIIITHNGTEPTIYVDNTKPAQSFVTDVDRTCWFGDLGALDNANLGKLAWDGTNTEYFDGLIDEFGAWTSKALDSDERSAIWNSGSGLSYNSFTS